MSLSKRFYLFDRNAIYTAFIKRMRKPHWTPRKNTARIRILCRWRLARVVQRYGFTLTPGVA